jgi:hypothetical protein
MVCVCVCVRGNHATHRSFIQGVDIFSVFVTKILLIKEIQYYIIIDKRKLYGLLDHVEKSALCDMTVQKLYLCSYWL